MAPESLSMFVDVRPRMVDEVYAPVDRGEVLRYLGYPAGAAPNHRLENLFDPWIEIARQHAAPRATYLVLPVAYKDRRRLGLQTVGGITQFKGAIGEFLGAAQYVAAFIATAGPGVEALAGKLMRQGEVLPAMVVDAVGAERAEAAETVVIEQLRARTETIGFAPTLPYSPGYCGMRLAEQTKLFALLDGASVGVTLTKDCLMRPLKSVSGLIGLGLVDHIQAAGSPCQRCELYTCAMRR